MALSDPSASAPREQMERSSSGCVRDGSNVGRWMIGTSGQSLVVNVCMQRLRKEVGGRGTFGVRRSRLLARLSRKPSLPALQVSFVRFQSADLEEGRLTAKKPGWRFRFPLGGGHCGGGGKRLICAANDLRKTVESQAIDVHDIGVGEIERRIQIERFIPVPLEGDREVIQHGR
jgi:hypothetical protein